MFNCLNVTSFRWGNWILFTQRIHILESFPPTQGRTLRRDGRWSDVEYMTKIWRINGYHHNVTNGACDFSHGDVSMACYCG